VVRVLTRSAPVLACHAVREGRAESPTDSDFFRAFSAPHLNAALIHGRGRLKSPLRPAVGGCYNERTAFSFRLDGDRPARHRHRFSHRRTCPRAHSRQPLPGCCGARRRRCMPRTSWWPTSSFPAERGHTLSRLLALSGYWRLRTTRTGRLGQIVRGA
jgi:hypothetical protein